LAKRRAANMASLYDEEPPESGLYGEWQTEEYIPEPIINVSYGFLWYFFNFIDVYNYLMT